MGCPCGFPVVGVMNGDDYVKAFSPEWHRLHKVAHLDGFPDVDQGTIDNLDFFIARADDLEHLTAGVSDAH